MARHALSFELDIDSDVKVTRVVGVPGTFDVTPHLKKKITVRKAIA